MAWRSGLAYSQDPRDRVLAAVDEGRAVREAAPLFRGSIPYVYKALERRAATGDVAPRRGGGSRPPKLAGHEAALLAHVGSRPDATLAELRRWLFETRGVGVSAGCLRDGLERLGWTPKKGRGARRSRTVLMSPPPGRPGGQISRA